MKIQVFGGVARVHALVWALLKCPSLTAIICAPGNAGIAGEKLLNGDSVICFPVSPTDIEGQLALAREHKPDRVIIMEDDPLSLGATDRFQTEGFSVWGPTRIAAQFEWSKIWAFEFAQRSGF